MNPALHFPLEANTSAVLLPPPYIKDLPLTVLATTHHKSVQLHNTSLHDLKHPNISPTSPHTQHAPQPPIPCEPTNIEKWGGGVRTTNNGSSRVTVEIALRDQHQGTWFVRRSKPLLFLLSSLFWNPAHVPSLLGVTRTHTDMGAKIMISSDVCTCSPQGLSSYPRN